MKVKRRIRYYCDFCKKSSGKRDAMELHEKHCTMNPDRHCRVCGSEDSDLLKAGLVRMELSGDEEGHIQPVLQGMSDFHERLQERGLTVLRLMDGCPACALALIRQGQINAQIDYQKEFKIYMDDKDPEERYG